MPPCESYNRTATTFAPITHALTNPLLSPHVFNEATFTAEGMRTITTTSRLRDILARNDTLHPDAFISMDQDGYDSVA